MLRDCGISLVSSHYIFGFTNARFVQYFARVIFTWDGRRSILTLNLVLFYPNYSDTLTPCTHLSLHIPQKQTFFIQERFNRLIYGINTIIKYAI